MPDGPSCASRRTTAALGLPRRLVNKADFERLLGQRAAGRSAHFALHHVAVVPQKPTKPASAPRQPELSTDLSGALTPVVDNLPDAVWFGCVVPKRHARRAVTRSLLKRQVRGGFERHAPGLPAGLWLLRLRAPFAVTDFVSAASPALAAAARGEIDGLLARAGGVAR